MRTIKFRAWDTLPNNGNPKGFCYFSIAELNSGKINFPDLENWEVMQFTGLLDKNGKEIYEGDLVKSKAHNPHTYEVQFLEGGFCATHPNLSSYPLDLNHFYDSTGCAIEVVGNVYENPELLAVADSPESSTP